jgi:hypothetical protein
MFFVFGVNAQDSLCIYKLNGESYIKSGTNYKRIKKGNFIKNGSTVVLKHSSNFTAISYDGLVYKLNKSGNYDYKDILQLNEFKTKSGLTSKYFKLIWTQLTQKEETKTIIGGVFRGESLMLFPLDSSKIVGSKITLKWQTEDEVDNYYIFLKEKNTDKILKYSTNGSELTIYKDYEFLSQGNTYYWAVTTIEFPNLKNIPFFEFQYIDREEYNLEKNKYEVFIDDLKMLGLDKMEIDNLICKTYSLCKN